MEFHVKVSMRVSGSIWEHLEAYGRGVNAGGSWGMLWDTGECWGNVGGMLGECWAMLGEMLWNAGECWGILG